MALGHGRLACGAGLAGDSIFGAGLRRFSTEFITPVKGQRGIGAINLARITEL